MLTLALDTSSAAVTVAVLDDAGGSPDVLAERSVVDARRHAELLAPMVSEVLADAGRRVPERVVVGVGPGPFTGLRVGVVTAHAIGDALGVPVVGVCSLDALAADAGGTGPLLVATDARRREVYWASYDAGRRVAGPEVARPADLAERVAEGVVPAGARVVGEGARLYPEALPGGGEPWRPTAAGLVRALAGGAPALEPRPLYLRRPDAVVPGAPKPVLA